MGLSVGILSVESCNLEEYFKKEKTLLLAPQGTLTLGNFAKKAKSAPAPETKIKLLSSDDEKAIFEVEHYADAVKQPIRTWTLHTGVEEDIGYQAKYKFKMTYLKKEKELVVIASKQIFGQLLKRFENRKDLLDGKKRKFNLNMNKVQGILNVYGSWIELDDANVKCRGDFGVDVHKSLNPKHKIIAVNLVVKLEDEKKLNIAISHDGQISSNMKEAKASDLIKFYNNIKGELLKELPKKVPLEAID